MTRDAFNFSYPDRSEDTTYTYGPTNRLTSAERNGTTTTYSYDPASGALASYKRGAESIITLACDTKGRIQTAGAMRYSHDPLGRRDYSGPVCEFTT